MIYIIASILAVLSLLIFGFTPGLSNIARSEIYSTYAPNIVAEFIGLALALLIAEVIIYRYKAARGTKQVGPILLKTMAPIYALNQEILKLLAYTPKEFKVILKDYILGHYNPIHIPQEFKVRLTSILPQIKPPLVDAAIRSANDAVKITSRFASFLDAGQIVMVDRANHNWTRFRDAIRAKPQDASAITEAFLDAHDDSGDTLRLFKFDALIKRFLNR